MKVFPWARPNCTAGAVHQGRKTMKKYKDTVAVSGGRRLPGGGGYAEGEVALLHPARLPGVPLRVNSFICAVV